MNIEKHKMQSIDKVSSNIEKLSEIFPMCITEVKDEDGTKKRVVDFELLKQELQTTLVEGQKERYSFAWAGKKQCILEANSSINKTLRPVKDESINFDNTSNLFIEGDNLDALKLLQTSYLNKIKMIYIDPPYNTGKDFIYKDNFTQEKDEHLEKSGQIDNEGNLLTTNKESNGRFHSDWLSMIYPRLKLARDLLAEDGVIFISIDDNEVANLRKIGNDIFGEDNFVGDFIRKTKSTTNDIKTGVNIQHEYLILFCKNKNNIKLLGDEKDLSRYKNPDNDPKGDWASTDPSAKSGSSKNYFPVINIYTGEKEYPPKGMYWRFSNDTLQQHIKSGRIKFKESCNDGGRSFIFKRYKSELITTKKTFDTLKFATNDYMNQVATKEFKDLGLVEYFPYPKGINFIKEVILYGSDKNSIILDFFAGSGTTAHAVMQLNSEDGGKRKFIMVQIPQKCDEKSQAFKAGFKTIADICKERITRAGEKILKDNLLNITDLDVGFRTLKVDTSNMKDIYYKPDEIKQDDLLDQISSIKENRTNEDLLFQVMLDWGLELSLPITIKEHTHKKIFIVKKDEETKLVACFDEIDNSILYEVVKIKPSYFTFREDKIVKDSDKLNFKQRLKQLSSDIEIKTI